MLMGDEGIGVHVVRALAERLAGREDVELTDLGAGAGLPALHAMQGRERAVFIDCALMGEAPGAIRRFTPETVRSARKLAGASLHEGDLLGTLELATRLGERPPEVVIFGIEPASMAPATELSPALAERFEEYLDAVAAELE